MLKFATWILPSVCLAASPHEASVTGPADKITTTISNSPDEVENIEPITDRTSVVTAPAGRPLHPLTTNLEVASGVMKSPPAPTPPAEEESSAASLLFGGMACLLSLPLLAYGFQKLMIELMLRNFLDTTKKALSLSSAIENAMHNLAPLSETSKQQIPTLWETALKAEREGKTKLAYICYCRAAGLDHKQSVIKLLAIWEGLQAQDPKFQNYRFLLERVTDDEIGNIIRHYDSLYSELNRPDRLNNSERAQFQFWLGER